jgi:hypothetical protein
VLSGEATNTNLIVFGLTRPGLEFMIYRTRGEHTNHYTTDAVDSVLNMQALLSMFKLGYTVKPALVTTSIKQ